MFASRPSRLVATILAAAAGTTLAVTAPAHADPPILPPGQAKTSLVVASVDPEIGSMSFWVGDPASEAGVQLTFAPSDYFDTHPIRSPDGKRILFMRETWKDEPPRIGVVGVADPASLEWIDTGCASTPDCAADINPTWSVDGKRIMFTRVMGPFDERGTAASAVLYSTDLDGSDLRRVSVADLPWDVEDTVARPTPDGEYLVFIRDQFIVDVLHFAVFRMRPDGSDVTQLTPWELNADRPVPSPARSGPTAGMLAFETYGGAEPGRGDILLIPWTCSGPEDCMSQASYVTHNDGGPRSSFAAAWSPDGLSLAYAEEPGERQCPEVWVSRWDGSERSQFSHSGCSVYPTWGT